MIFPSAYFLLYSLLDKPNLYRMFFEALFSKDQLDFKRICTVYLSSSKQMDCPIISIFASLHFAPLRLIKAASVA